MNGIKHGDSGVGRGIGKGTFGLEVADVGRAGSERSDGVRPGTRRATTLGIERGLYKIRFEPTSILRSEKGTNSRTSTRSQFGGGASAERWRTRSRIS
jgi:hypothetical protein